MRNWKWLRSPYKGRWQRKFSELQAMDSFTKRVSEEQNPMANFLSILNDCFNSFGIKPSRSAYSYITKYLFQRRLYSQLSIILDHLENAETFKVSERFLAKVIINYGKAGMHTEAVDIFFRIRRFRCTHTVLTMNSLLYVLCKRRENIVLVHDVLVKCLAMRIHLEASNFCLLIKALCRNKKVGAAVELIDMLQCTDCAPDARWYSLVLCSLCKEEGSVEVMAFWEKMQKNGLSPSPLDNNSVIGVLVREGKTCDAYTVLMSMKSEGKMPDISSCNRVLAGFIFANEFQRSDELFDEILLMGITPNIFTYNIYMKGLCIKGDFGQAHRLIICMEKAGCKPDKETFNILLDGYRNAGKLVEARGIMNEILEKGFQYNVG